VGELVGVLTITHPSLSRPFIVTNYSLPLDYHFGIPAPPRVIHTTKQLAYGGDVIFRGTGAKAPNAGVEFQRTGGIATVSDRVTTVTSDVGFFLLNLQPADDAAVGD